MTYKCVKGFSVPLVDGDGFQTDKYSVVLEGSLWKRNDKNNKFDGEVHLDSLSDKSDWLEMDKESLKEYFVLESEGK